MPVFGGDDPMVQVDLSQGDAIWCEPDGMVMMDSTHDLEGSHMQYEIGAGTCRNQGPLGILVNSVPSAKIVVLKFRGPGKLLLCSRNRNTFRQWVASTCSS